MKLNDFFDKIYYINLDRRTDRREYIESLLEKNNLLSASERIVAEDGINEPDFVKKHSYCSLSHHKVYEKMNDLGLDKVLILEDDFSFYNNDTYKGLENIEKGIDQLVSLDLEWDILYLGGYIFDDKIKQVSDNLLEVQTVLTNHGYGVSRNGARLIQKHRPFVDSVIDGWIGNQKHIKKYMIYPISSYQTSFESDLDVNGRTPPVEHWLQDYIRTGSLVDERRVK